MKLFRRTAVGVLLHQVRVDAAALLTMGLVLGTTAAVASALPELLNEVDDQAVRYELAQGQEIEDVVLRVDATTPVDLAAAEQAITSLAEQLEPPFDDSTDAGILFSNAEEDALVLGIGDSARPQPPDLPPLGFSPRVIVGADDQLRVVEGAMPAGGTLEPGPFGGAPEPYDTAAGELMVPEVLVSQETADLLELGVGDVVVTTSAEPVVALRISGIFEAVDPDAYVWQRNAAALEPEQVFGLGGRTIFATAVVTGGSLEAYATADAAVAPSPVPVSIGLPLTVDRMTAPVAEALYVGADRLESRSYSAILPGAAAESPETSIQVPVERYLQQRSTTHAVGAVAVGGLLVAVIAVLCLTTQLTAERRRGSLALARARGATIRQLTTATAVETFLVAAVSAVVGWAVGTTLADGRPTAASWWAVGGLVLAATAAATAIVGWEHRVVGRTERRDLSVTRATPRRLAAEVALVVLAVGGLVLLRQRGVTASDVDGSFDPFMVLVPVIVALSVAVVVLRFYPVPIRMAGRSVASRPGPVGFLGLARAGREPSGTAAPLVVLLVALTFAVFASIVAGSIRVEQQATAWQTVGADVRVDGNRGNVWNPETDIPLLAEAAGTTTDDVVAVHRDTTATVNDLGSSGLDFTYVVLDPEEFAELVGTWPVPGPDVTPLISAAPGTAERVPAIVSTGMRDAVFRSDREVEFFMPGARAVLDPVGTVDTFPGLQDGSAFAIMRLPDVEQVADLAYGASQLFVDVPDGAVVDIDAVDEVARDLQPFAQVTGRDAEFSLIRDAPFTGAVQLGFFASFLIAAIYCVIAVVLALVVTSGSRGRTLSFLRTLGMTERQARGLVTWEIMPMAVITAVVGVVLGLALPALVGPAIDLRPFTGGTRLTPFLADPIMIAGLAGGLLAVVAVTTLVVAALNRRTGLGRVLRVGEEN